MLYVIKWLYMWILPLGGVFLTLFAILIYMFRKRAAGRWALLVTVLCFYGLSIQPVSHLFVHPLETRYEQPPLDQLDGDVIILLGGGSLAGVPDFDGTGQLGLAASHRFLTAVRIQKALHIPILLSGGVVFAGDANEAAIEKRMLLSLEVEEKDIISDEKSRNTAENARFARELCDALGWHPPSVVTSGFHLARAIGFFTREGMNVTPYPCDYRTTDTYRLSLFSFIPQSIVLFDSCLAIKEYVGMMAAKAGLQ